MEHLTLRPASLSDASAIARLMEQLGYPTETQEMEERLTGLLSQSDYQTLVAERNRRIVGMIGLHVGHSYEKNGVYGQIVALVVEQAHQGQHIGSSLVAEGERWLKTRGVQIIIVNSGMHRQAAHRFYEHLGYQATGIRLVKTFA
ncbi:GNAT family N-acetyltransferase [Ktedonobacter racemifer]|uniref:GCN5-related N-acetyltransferase n=1 Tax=Ktedonobacter racemifer DSM 44963 TaxID=485913 RepID=D6TBH1_KTERA|nr:GNAT family N-acetyltransferase [Ktedonobacter racemifer]EFH87955.1 GCN5-related N-acetyltransferase [Ktedonobacter racemifer DSM 44963]